MPQQDLDLEKKESKYSRAPKHGMIGFTKTIEINVVFLQTQSLWPISRYSGFQLT